MVANFTRRTFLQSSLGASALAPMSQALRQPGQIKNGVGIIGLGYRGFQLLERIGQIDEVELTAFGDLWEDHFNRLREMGYERRFYTPMYFKVILASNARSVILALPDHLQSGVLEATLHADKDAYVEVPVTRYPEQWQKIEAQLARSSRLLFVGNQSFSNPVFKEAARWIQQGKIGSPLSAHGEISGHLGGYSILPPDPTLERRKWIWFRAGLELTDYSAEEFFQWNDFSDYSGGPAMRHLQHLMAALMVVLAWPTIESVSALSGSRREESRRDVPQSVSALLRNSDIPISVSAADSRRARRLEITIEGEDGTLQLSDDALDFFPSSHFAPARKRWSERVRDESEMEMASERTGDQESEPGETFRSEADPTLLHLREFVARLKSGDRQGNWREARQLEMLGHSIREAAVSGEAVRVEGGSEPDA